MPSNRTIAQRHQREGKPPSYTATHLDLSLAEVMALLAPRPRKPLKRTPAKCRRQSISPASPKQRQKVKGEVCIVRDCSVEECAPAHVIDRGLLADRENDPLRVVPLCPDHHREYDEGKPRLDLLPHLQRSAPRELARAVEVFGLLPTLHRVTGQRWAPMDDARRAA